MNATPFVLLYGRDPQLQKTREWILDTIGCPSQMASTSEEIQSRLPNPSLALVVVCHSIPAAEAEAVIEAVHHQRPDLRILVLVATPSLRLRRTGERTLDTQEGPGPLLEAVQHLMADHGTVPAKRPTVEVERRVVRLPIVPGE